MGSRRSSVSGAELRLLLLVLADVAAIPTNVTTVLPHIAPILTHVLAVVIQIRFIVLHILSIVSEVALFFPHFGRIALALRFAKLPPVLTDVSAIFGKIAIIVANVAAVVRNVMAILTDVASIAAHVAPIAAQIAPVGRVGGGRRRSGLCRGLRGGTRAAEHNESQGHQS